MVVAQPPLLRPETLLSLIRLVLLPFALAAEAILSVLSLWRAHHGLLVGRVVPLHWLLTILVQHVRSISIIAELPTLHAW